MDGVLICQAAHVCANDWILLSYLAWFGSCQLDFETTINPRSKVRMGELQINVHLLRMP